MTMLSDDNKLISSINDDGGYRTRARVCTNVCKIPAAAATRISDVIITSNPSYAHIRIQHILQILATTADTSLPG